MARMILVNMDRCVGCHTCELECAVAHSKSKDLMQLVRDGEKPGRRIYVERIGEKPVPINCCHCEKAACMMVCPTGAIRREGEMEPVLVDNSLCIGCGMCVQACPFGVILLDSQGKGARKCDLCIERLSEGQEPACVASCPTKTLEYVKREEAGTSKRINMISLLTQSHKEYEKDQDSLVRYE